MGQPCVLLFVQSSTFRLQFKWKSGPCSSCFMDCMFISSLQRTEGGRHKQWKHNDFIHKLHVRCFTAATLPQQRRREKREHICKFTENKERNKTKGIFTYHCWHNWHACRVSEAACGLQDLVEGLTNVCWCFQRKMQNRGWLKVSSQTCSC